MQSVSPFARLTEFTALMIILEVQQAIAGQATIGISPVDRLMKKSALLPCKFNYTG